MRAQNARINNTHIWKTHHIPLHSVRFRKSREIWVFHEIYLHIEYFTDMIDHKIIYISQTAMVIKSFDITGQGICILT